MKVHHDFFSQNLPERQIQGEGKAGRIVEMDPIIGRDVLQELQELPGPPSKSKRSGKGYAVRLVPSSPLLDSHRLRDVANVAHMEDLHIEPIQIACLWSFLILVSSGYTAE